MNALAAYGKPTMNALSGLGLRPFDPAQDVPQDMGLGGISTEYTVTNEAPDGGFWNIPSIWWTEDGKPSLVDTDAAQAFAMEYEKRTGKKFSRYPDPGMASFFAMSRSANGGGQ